MDSQTKNKRIIVILIVLIWILIIIAITFVINALKAQDPVHLANTNSAEVSSLINGDNKKRLQKYLTAAVDAIDPTRSQNDAVEFTIRESSIQTEDIEGDTKKANFIIDIDSLKYTFAVQMVINPIESVQEDIYFTCPSIAQMKYKETFCIGDLETSTISVLFGKNFTYTGKIGDDNYSAYPERDANNKPVIAFYARTCEENAEDRILSNFKEHFSSLDYDLSTLPYDTSEIKCYSMEQEKLYARILLSISR